jgi:hypothetical protein
MVCGQTSSKISVEKWWLNTVRRKQQMLAGVKYVLKDWQGSMRVLVREDGFVQARMNIDIKNGQSDKFLNKSD